MVLGLVAVLFGGLNETGLTKAKAEQEHFGFNKINFGIFAQQLHEFVRPGPEPGEDEEYIKIIL